MLLMSRRALFSAVRVWLGVQWFEAGLHKVGATAWTGDKAGAAVSGFVKGAIGKAADENPAVQPWFADLLEGAVLPNAALFGYLVAYGELFAGIGLILGVFTGFAALGGAVMNLSFMLAGTTSTNPILYTASMIVLATLTYAQFYGFDSVLRPRVEYVAEERLKKIRGKLIKSHA